MWPAPGAVTYVRPMHTTDNPTATIMKALSCIFNQGSCPGSLPLRAQPPNTRTRAQSVSNSALRPALREAAQLLRESRLLRRRTNGGVGWRGTPNQMCKMHLETHVETQFTPADVRAHNKATDCWITVKGRVYDVTPWLASHPGGPDIVLLYAGDDATDVFTAFHHTREYVPSVHASLPQCPRIPTAPSTQVPRCWATCRRGASDLGPLRHAYGGGICVPHDAASDSRYYPVGREGRAGM
jgi:cytochrome b involved in lipid metabolism